MWKTGVVLFFVSAALNELLLQFCNNHVILVGWALLCLWILFDASFMVTQLERTETALREQVARNNTLHAQNLALSTQLLREGDQHQMLCELRSKIRHAIHKLREHHQMSVEIQPRVCVSISAKLDAMDARLDHLGDSLAYTKLFPAHGKGVGPHLHKQNSL